MFGFRAGARAPAILRLGSDRGAACAEIHAQSFAHPWSAHEFETLLAAPTSVADGAFAGRSKLVGFVLSRLSADEAEVLSIAVAPGARKTGIGVRLLNANLSRLAAAGAKTLFLEVDAVNHPALSLYRRFGFAPVGERTAYYRAPDGSRCKALIMRRDFV